MVVPCGVALHSYTLSNCCIPQAVIPYPIVIPPQAAHPPPPTCPHTCTTLYCYTLPNTQPQTADPSPTHAHNFIAFAYGTRQKLICFQWNENASASCPYPNCKFQHICYICAYDPAVTDVSHKALYCPKRRGLQTSPTAPGSTSKGYKPRPLMQV